MGAKILNSIGTERDGNFEGKDERVELAIRDTETPDEMVDVNYVFLMRFGGEHNHRSPGVASPRVNPASIKQCGDVSGRDFLFMHTITR